MRWALKVFAAAMVAALCACGEVVSLSPVVAPDRSFLDPGFAGPWREVAKPDEKPGTKHDLFTIERDDAGGYSACTPGEAFEGVKVRMLLAEAGSARYLDMFFEPAGGKADTYLGMGMVSHRIHKYTREGDRFSLRGMDFDRCKELLEKPGPGVSFARTEDGVAVDAFTPAQQGQAGPFQRIVFTDTPARLQAWLAAHEDDPKLWGDATWYERVREEAPAAKP